jgi:hypothetical protein
MIQERSPQQKNRAGAGSRAGITKAILRLIIMQRDFSNRFNTTKSSATWVRVGTRSNFGYADFVAEPIENNPPIADSKPIYLALFSFDGFGIVERMSGSHKVLDLLYDAALSFGWKFIKIMLGVLREAINHLERPSLRSIVLAETIPDFLDASRSFQNFGLAYSMLSSKSSKEFEKRRNASRGFNFAYLVWDEVFAMRTYGIKCAA